MRPRLTSSRSWRDSYGSAIWFLRHLQAHGQAIFVDFLAEFPLYGRVTVVIQTFGLLMIAFALFCFYNMRGTANLGKRWAFLTGIVFVGAGLLIHQRITQLRVLGIGTIQAAEEKAASDAKEVGRLRKDAEKWISNITNELENARRSTELVSHDAREALLYASHVAALAGSAFAWDQLQTLSISETDAGRRAKIAMVNMLKDPNSPASAPLPLDRQRDHIPYKDSISMMFRVYTNTIDYTHNRLFFIQSASVSTNWTKAERLRFLAYAATHDPTIMGRRLATRYFSVEAKHEFDWQQPKKIEKFWEEMKNSYR